MNTKISLKYNRTYDKLARMQKNYEVLFAKHQQSITKRLEDAICGGKVTGRYSSERIVRNKRESMGRFVRRLAMHSAKPQFVKVIFDGQSHFVAFGVTGPLVTTHGVFEMIPAQVVGGRWGIHHLLFYPSYEEVIGRKSTFIRIDSGCLSGQVFGDITCDCKEQFDISLKRCVRRGGIVVHIPDHDGRGWGEYKMANQFLMHKYKMDTVTAARAFYGDESAIDQRTYTETVVILKALGFDENHYFELATNNPRKVGAFNAFGFKLAGVQSIVAPTLNKNQLKNLKAKKNKWGHRMGNLPET